MEVANGAAGTLVSCSCGNSIQVPGAQQRESAKMRPPVDAVIAGGGVALCPQCGVRNYYKKHHVGSVKRCTNCGQRLVLSKWKGCLVVVLVFIVSAIGFAVAVAR